MLSSSAPSWAALGEYESSVGADQQYFRAEIRQKNYAGYTVQQIITPQGTVIREYISPAGKVFGVAWQARSMPNLQQLLGSYFPQVMVAAQAQAHRGPLVVRSNDLVFASAGHMMAFHGAAYVPSLLPSHLSGEAVR